MYALGSRATTTPSNPPMVSPPPRYDPPSQPSPRCCCADLPLLLQIGGAAVPLATPYGTQPLLRSQSGICAAVVSRIRHELHYEGCMVMVMVAAVL